MSTSCPRQTFYQLFESKQEILEYHLDSLFSGFLREIEHSRAISFHDLATIYFKFFMRNSDFVRHLVENNLTGILNERFAMYLPRIPAIAKQDHGIESNLDYAFEFMSSGLVGVLVYWIRKGQDIPIDELVDTLSALMRI